MIAKVLKLCDEFLAQFVVDDSNRERASFVLKKVTIVGALKVKL